jgi:uncharacterized protein YhfF
VTFPTHNGDRTLELGNPGQMRDNLNALVLSGQKRATAALWEMYPEEGEPLETEGEQLWLLDSQSQPIAQLEITRVDIRKLNQIDLDFVVAEGEGFADVQDWEKQQRAYWSATAETEMQAAGFESWRVTNKTLVVCLWFRLVNRDSDLLSRN